MKTIIKITVFCVLITTLSTVYAQDIDKGKLEVSGALDFSSQSIKVEGETGNDVDIDVSLLYYFRKNLGIGLSLNLENSDFGSGQFKESTDSFGVGPQLSYNFSIGTNTGLKLRGGVLFSTIDIESFTERTNGTGISWNVGGQISYFLRDNISINSSIDYVSTTIDFKRSSDTVKMTGVSTGIGLSVYF